MYITVRIDVPAKLTSAQKAALEQFDAATDMRQTAKMREYRSNVQSLYGVDPYDKK